MEEHGFVFRGEDVARQILFVMGDFEKDTRTHHIHAVKWNGTEWKNYINFRDYLNCVLIKRCYMMSVRKNWHYNFQMTEKAIRKASKNA